MLFSDLGPLGELAFLLGCVCLCIICAVVFFILVVFVLPWCWEQVSYGSWRAYLSVKERREAKRALATPERGGT